MLLVLRAMMVGAIVACCFFLVGVARQGEPLREESLVEPMQAPSPSATTIVDIAPGVPRDRIAGLIALGPGERVSAVGERAVESDLEAGAAIAALAPAAGRFLDLTVDGRSGSRRVLVLVH